MYDNYEIPEEEWVIRMPLRAYRLAMALEAVCKACGGDSYDEVSHHLHKAQSTREAKDWAHVWNYIQARNAAGKDDRFLVVIDMPS